FERGKEAIQGLQRRPAKVLERRMKVDGMNRDDGWYAARKALLGKLYVFFDRQLSLRGFEVNGPIEVQNLPLINVRSENHAAAVLGDSDSLLRPGKMGIVVCAITWRTGRQGDCGEEFSKSISGPTNQF